MSAPNDRPPALLLTGVSKSYGNRAVLRDVSLVVQPGEMVALVGLNGAGKTTLLEGIIGLRPFDSGVCRVFGDDLAGDRRAFLKHVGAQLQVLELQDKITVLEAVRLHAAYHGLVHDPVWLERHGLSARAHHRFEALSLGERQRLAALLASLHGPRLLLLDEPMAAMDPVARRDYASRLREHVSHGGAVLLSTHDLGEVSRLCTRAVLLSEGCISELNTDGVAAGPESRTLFVRLSPDVSAGWFAGLPGLSRVTPEEPGWSLVFDRLEEGLSALLERVRASGMRVSGLSTGGSPELSGPFDASRKPGEGAA